MMGHISKLSFCLLFICLLSCKKERVSIEQHPDVDIPLELKSGGVSFIDDGKSAIFTLLAPGKKSVKLLGDFNNFSDDEAAEMTQNTDGELWWKQIDHLDPNQIYTYQFLVDGNIKIADPYTQLVLDPANDPYISPETFPNLLPYPIGKTTGLVSIAQYKEETYHWKIDKFNKPNPYSLVIYELLVRDFLATHHYQTLQDTLSYLTNLGVNAVELMPVNEFEGNLSWGYNPSFYFAPDKYYGTKNELKAFIDKCHAHGIAVIIDMVLNHSFGQSPMVQLYFKDNQPTVNNPWFNVTPTHPFNVGYDMNHESEYTKDFVKKVLKFWIEEYKIDGFRFDLSKGFTQKNSGTAENNVEEWSAYDPSRIAIWKDYNRFIRSVDPTSYVILEHFAEDKEELELANDGMFLWNNLNYGFNEATMGWVDIGQSDISRMIYSTHGFTAPNLVSYMESHDEERLMFKNLAYGNSNVSYNVQDLKTALKRVELAAAFLFTAPGPKMIWQFGELGYDISIEQNGRTGEKPIRWDYNQGDRRNLYEAFSRLIHLKKNNSIFDDAAVQYQLRDGVKYMLLTKGLDQVLVVGNFDVVAKEVSIGEVTGGLWYDNIKKVSKTLTQGFKETLAPGQYYILSKQALN